MEGNGGSSQILLVLYDFIPLPSKNANMFKHNEMWQSVMPSRELSNKPINLPPFMFKIGGEFRTANQFLPESSVFAEIMLCCDSPELIIF